MPDDANGVRRPIQFWVAIIGIGGLVLAVLALLVTTFTLSLYGDAEAKQSDTLNNALLLSLGGLVGLAGSIGAWLFSRGAQGEPIPSGGLAATAEPGQTVTTTVTGRGAPGTQTGPQNPTIGDA